MKVSPEGLVIYENNDELNAACFIWQKRLFLRDWDVTVKIGRMSEFTGNVARAGEIQLMRGKKLARLTVLHPEDYETTNVWVDQDHEKTLVHELLHIKFSWMDLFGPAEATEESSGEHQVLFAIWDQETEITVDQLARSLVNGYRSLRPMV